LEFNSIFSTVWLYHAFKLRAIVNKKAIRNEGI